MPDPDTNSGIDKKKPEGKVQAKSSYQPKEFEQNLDDDHWNYPLTKVKEEAQPYRMLLPPPNVTGSLHIGHALTCTIQDAIIRYQRMCGRPTAWIPGTDHAGISTQTVVERKLMESAGRTRHDLGREAFLGEVWKWKEQYHQNITTQLKRLGCLLDWEQEYFTMDQRVTKTTHWAFRELYHQGLIYRAERLVNWDSTLKTAISEIEIEKVPFDRATPYRYRGYPKTVEFGVMDYFFYPIESSGSTNSDLSGVTVTQIEIATTRLETMLGDVAIAVHRDHPKWGGLVGQHVLHPFTGERLPIIHDEMADIELGTGAVKITPSHDPNDYQCALRHNLPKISIFDENGYLNENAGEFKGLHRFDARKVVIKRLKELNLYHKRVDHPMVIPVSSRTGDPIEYHLKPQWYLNCSSHPCGYRNSDGEVNLSMAEKAIEAVKTGQIELYPPEAKHEYFRWLESPQDWCISRQLWWGHRIPLYYKIGPAGEETWALEPEEGTKQDEDVLDTWFSSALLPIACQEPGASRATEEMVSFDLLETGKDILFFWVTRMIMLSLQLTGKVPFKKVLLHGMVRDAQGRKMSKSLGNVIDPLDVIDGITLERMIGKIESYFLDPKEKQNAIRETRRQFPKGIPECGTDALRFALLKTMNGTDDLNLNINEVVKSRHFCNKLYNLVQFYLLYSKETTSPLTSVNQKQEQQSLLRCWILGRLEQTRAICQQAFQDYSFHQATRALYEFLYTNLCDVYLEAVKPKLSSRSNVDSDNERVSYLITLKKCLVDGLSLLHPFMPFLTQGLIRIIKGTEEGDPDHLEYGIIDTEMLARSPGLNGEMEKVLTQVHQILATKAEQGLTRKDFPTTQVSHDFTQEELELISRLAYCQAIPMPSTPEESR